MSLRCFAKPRCPEAKQRRAYFVCWHVWKGTATAPQPLEPAPPAYGSLLCDECRKKGVWCELVCAGCARAKGWKT